MTETLHLRAVLYSEQKGVASARGEEIAAGEEALGAALDMARAGRAALAAGASSLARGAGALAVSERAAVLSKTVGAAGGQDVAQGAELLTASEDLAVMGAIVAGMSDDDLEQGMELAAISGQLTVAGDMLADRGDWLRDIARDSLLRYGATRALSEAMTETSGNVAGLSVGEVAEGLTRMAVSEDIAVRSKVQAEAGVELTAEGLADLVAAKAIREASLELADDAADLGASETLHATAEAVETRADASEN